MSASLGSRISDILGPPVDGIPPGGHRRFIEEIGLTVAWHCLWNGCGLREARP